MSSRTLADPTAVRPHREIPGSVNVAGAVVPQLGTGATLTSGQPLSVTIPIAGAYAFAARFRASVAGTLAAAFVRPDGTAYGAGNPSSVAVTASTDVILPADSLRGEGNIRLTFTPGANGTVTYLDVHQLP